jgi:hypothetical protein
MGLSNKRREAIIRCDPKCSIAAREFAYAQRILHIPLSMFEFQANGTSADITMPAPVSTPSWHKMLSFSTMTVILTRSTAHQRRMCSATHRCPRASPSRRLSWPTTTATPRSHASGSVAKVSSLFMSQTILVVSVIVSRRAARPSILSADLRSWTLPPRRSAVVVPSTTLLVNLGVLAHPPCRFTLVRVVLSATLAVMIWRFRGEGDLEREESLGSLTRGSRAFIKGPRRAWRPRYSQTLVLIVHDEELGGYVKEGAAFDFLGSYVHMVEDIPQRRPNSTQKIPGEQYTSANQIRIVTRYLDA